MFSVIVITVYIITLYYNSDIKVNGQVDYMSHRKVVDCANAFTWKLWHRYIKYIFLHTCGSVLHKAIFYDYSLFMNMRAYQSSIRK